LDKAQRKVERRARKTQSAKSRVRKTARKLENAKGKRADKLEDKLAKILDILAARKDALGDAREKRNALRSYKVEIPGVENPVIQPFMTADDLLESSEADAALNETVTGLDTNLTEQQRLNEVAKAELARQQLYDRRDAADNAAARGLAHSSIRDAELYDIDATAALRRNELDTQLSVATLDAGRQKLAAKAAWDNFQSAMARRMVENAAAASEGVPKYQIEPMTETRKLPIPRGQNPLETNPSRNRGQRSGGGKNDRRAAIVGG
jgi:hypothetical protein